MVGLTHNHKQYIIGFESRTLARKVARTIHPTAHPILKRNNVEDMSEVFNEELEYTGLEQFCVEALTVDYGANLTIPKRHPLNDRPYPFEAFEIPATSMLMYPFERSLGLVIPTEILNENDRKIEFLAHVIDPSGNVEMFKNMLASST